MILDRIALVLVIIGALNWGAVGLFGFDLVAFLCGGQMAVLSRVIYTVVGVAGLWCVSLLFRDRPAGGGGGLRPSPRIKFCPPRGQNFFVLSLAKKQGENEKKVLTVVGGHAILSTVPAVNGTQNMGV